MALSAKLQMRQSQALVMTPQLMQSIRLLQLSHVELEHFIEEEIEKNPLLERVDHQDDADRTPHTTPPVEDAAEGSLEQLFNAQDASAAAMSERLDTSMENVFPDDPGTHEHLGPALAAQWKSAPGGGGGDGFNLEDIIAAGTTLSEHVGEQIAFTFRDPVELSIARELADALDEAGYLRAGLEDVAERLGTPAQRVARVLAACQEFEPAGLFARDLAECLALQLRSRDRLDPAMQAMIAHLDLMARRDFAQLRRVCGVDDEDLLDMMAEIRALDPKPGLVFTAGTADPIVADVIVKPAQDGSWAIELNPDALPRVLVNQHYYTSVSQHAANQSERDFLAECLQSANRLTRSLDQRARTILKVAAEIVRQQDAFFLHGVRHLRPLNLRTVAEAIGMHESTVSRVTSNKYMMTPRGVFELRYFFTVAIASAEGGDAHSSEVVRHHIRELIEAEQPLAVLSDDAIVDLLRKAGVDIARRTVAKYRESMNIPSSVQRRREKRAVAAANG